MVRAIADDGVDDARVCCGECGELVWKWGGGGEWMKKEGGWADGAYMGERLGGAAAWIRAIL